MRPTWAEIDLDAFARNVHTVTSRLPAGSKLIAVLKADAYGHGAVELARRCPGDRVAMLATVTFEEAAELHDAGVALPLLVMGPMQEAQVALAAERGFTIGIPGPEELAIAVRVALERDVKIHLKLDSGMGRMGVTASELPRAIELIHAARGLKIEAIYTHFANASDPSDDFTDRQTSAFEQMLAELRAAGIDAPLHHMANSAAVMRGLVRPGDYARAGLVLYGGQPVDPAGDAPQTEPILRWRTEIVRIKELPTGSAVGYGTTFHTTRPSRIATLPVGYADGYNRLNSNRGEVLVRGRRAPVVGRVSMDLVTIDLTDIPGAAVGDEVILLGRQDREVVSAEEIAGRIGTISYEVFCNISARVPRVYRDGGKVVAIRSRFDR